MTNTTPALRPYQEEAVKKMEWAMSLPGADIVSLPTGSGKSHVIAEFVARTGLPILILVPNKELLIQDMDKLAQVVPIKDIGVYSASMNSKEVKKYTIATIQSAHKHPEQFAHYDVVIIDECDLVNPKNLTGMYNAFFTAIEVKKIYGLTATPFRQDMIYKRWGRLSWQLESITTVKMINRYYPFFWNRMLSVTNTRELVEEGYLSPVAYHRLDVLRHEDLPTNKSKSDFDLERVDEMLVNQYGDIAKAIEDLPHQSKIVYCTSIKQAEDLQTLIKGSVVVTSHTTAKERAAAVIALKAGQISTLLNVGIYTVGFDYPALECIVILRPTRSLRLHCQMLGRVSRTSPGKQMGHVYDFVGNVTALSKAIDIRIVKSTINGKWNVVTPTYPEGIHGEPLYKFKLKQPKIKHDD